MPQSKYLKPIDLYLMPGSAPCRAVWMTARALNLNVKIKVVDNENQLSPEYRRMNPQQTVPTINDNGFYLWESRAILPYFVDKYGKTDSLLPRDPQKRAEVNRLLCFDMGTLYKAVSNWLYPQLLAGKAPTQDAARALREALDCLNVFLENKDFATGNNLTIADIAILATVTFLEIKDYNLSLFKWIPNWVKRVKMELPFYEECNQGLYEWKMLLKQQESSYIV